MFFTMSASAQSRMSVSARFSVTKIGVSGSYHLKTDGRNESMIEVQASVGHNGKRYLLTGLYEESYSLSPEWKVYAGTGIHAGVDRKGRFRIVEEKLYNELIRERVISTEQKEFTYGADAIFGIKYIISSRLSVGADVQPYVDFINEKSLFIDAGVRIGVSF
jgi:hypothetical protein